MENMMTDNNTLQIHDVRKMLGQYFDATISPTDMAKLKTIAGRLASGLFACPDDSVRNDLMLIYSLSEFASESLSTVADRIPDSLEDRLNNHISMLAAETRRKRRKKFIAGMTAFSAAASVIALMGVVGFKYLSHNDLPSPTESRILIADVSLSEKTDPIPSIKSSSTEENPLLPTAASAFTDAPIKSAAAPAAKSKNTRRKSSKKTSGTPENNLPEEPVSQKDVFLAEANEALNPVPPFAKDAYSVSEEAFRVVPSGVTAYVETTHILVQPLSTLSQSIYNIYESMEVVSEALSALPTAFDAVSSSLLLLSEPLASVDD